VSRLALLAVLWAPWFFVILYFELFYSTTSDPSPSPEWLIWLLLFAALLGSSAPFGTTILGLVAIRKIKRSRGALRGQRLATFAALLYPMIFLLSTVLFVSGELLSEVLKLDGAIAAAWGISTGLALCFFTGRRMARDLNAPC